MTVTLYYTAASAPCRTVLLVAAALNVHLDLHILDIRGGEQYTPGFLKMNPQHTVPTLADGDFFLWESRAIARYLVNKYSPESSLYPQEPRARALVDQRLDFDLGTLYPRFAAFYYPTLFGGNKPDENLLNKLEESLKFFNSFLENIKYAAGDHLTLADLSLVATVSTIETVGIDLKPYPNVVRWLKLVKSTAPEYETANQKGINEFSAWINQIKAKKTEL